MYENKDMPQQRVVLVAADIGTYAVEESLEELALLADTAGALVVGTIVQNRSAISAAMYIGQGKLAEIKDFAHANEVDLLIFDDELTGTQIRNIEEATEVTTIDRTMLILDIFAQRAISSEGKLQVELAQQKYLLPRLTGRGVSLSRLGGGIGTRGPGESKLEHDRRHIRRRIEALEKDLKELEQHRSNTRQRRQKNNVPIIVIVGYTNAGKSTLLNLLTGAGVLVENKLFATLDPTARELKLPNGQSTIVIDTVGLIQRLPHNLVEAFRSTLEEAKSADLILNVCDIADPLVKNQIDVTKQVLSDLECADTPLITVCNKMDLLEEQPSKTMEDTVYISARQNEQVDRLLEMIVHKLEETIVHTTMLFLYSQLGMLDTIRTNGKVINEEYVEEGVRAEFTVDRKILQRLGLIERG